MRIKGLKIKAALYIDDSFLYCIQDNINAQPKMVIDGQDSIQNISTAYMPKGFYVYDIDRILEG